MSYRGVFTVIPTQVGVQDIQLIAFGIVLTLHFLSCLRENDMGFK